MKAETLKKPCVKFEEHRLTTLRENLICKKVNQNVNQERAAHPPPARTTLVTNARLLLQICNATERTFLITNNLFQLAPYKFDGVQLKIIGR